ncbi:MAG: hypothetical protein FJW35_11030 [Acidobacteria bacterium]|nr:hypothetical protein [Acidobacteriota bacterium]
MERLWPHRGRVSPGQCPHDNGPHTYPERQPRAFRENHTRGAIHRPSVVNLISNTTKAKGLSIRARLDANTYATGIKVKDEQIAALLIQPEELHGEWNHTISPRAPAKRVFSGAKALVIRDNQADPFEDRQLQLYPRIPLPYPGAEVPAFVECFSAIDIGDQDNAPEASPIDFLVQLQVDQEIIGSHGAGALFPIPCPPVSPQVPVVVALEPEAV